MKLECQLMTTKSGTGYYLYIPLIEKRVFLEKVEQKLIQLYMDKAEETNKNGNK